MQKNSTSLVALTLFIGLVVGFLGGRWYELVTPSSPASMEEEEGATLPPGEEGIGSPAAMSNQASFLGGSYALAVPDQAAGRQVTLASITLAERSWVVIHADQGGAPAMILGAGRFAPGTHTNARVDLLTPTQARSTYFAVIHATDADDIFNPVSDVARTDETGTILAVRFATTPQ